ncbi:MAG: DUF1987 domain-containing protein [Cyclobacteriaceae bacterium]
MNTISITSTASTPAVYFNPSKGIFQMKGRSSPENTPAFYSGLKTALASTQTVENLDVKICLEYFNTSSSKILFDIFRQLKSIKENGRDVNIKWFYEEYDEDMLEAGEDYSDILNLPFSFIEYHPHLQSA